MKKILAVVSLAILACLASPVQADEPLLAQEPVVEAPAPFPVFSKLVVRVLALHADNSVSAGTGFITTDGVFTAWHVIQDEGSANSFPFLPTSPAILVKIMLWDNTVYDVLDWRRIHKEDLCKLLVPALLPESALVLAEDVLAEDAPCTIVGYWGESLEMASQVMSLGRTRINAEISPWYDTYGSNFYKTTLMVGGGCSGGPVFVNGKIVGLLTGGSGNSTVISRLDRAHLRARQAQAVQDAINEAFRDDDPSEDSEPVQANSAALEPEPQRVLPRVVR